MAFLETLQKFGLDPCICISTTRPAANSSISPPLSPRRRRMRIFIAADPRPCSPPSKRPRPNRPRGDVHVEYFTAKAEAATAGGFWVELAQLRRGILHPRGQEGPRSAARCRRRCRLFLRARHLRRMRHARDLRHSDHRDAVLSEEEQAANDKVMICAAAERPSGWFWICNLVVAALDPALAAALDCGGNERKIRHHAHHQRPRLSDPRRAAPTLVDAIRDDCGQTGTVIGCEHGVCGTCTVIVDDEAVRSCLMFAIQAQGKKIRSRRRPRQRRQAASVAARLHREPRPAMRLPARQVSDARRQCAGKGPAYRRRGLD